MKNISVQLELSARAGGLPVVNRKQQRMQRARWWFGKMRQVVDLAMPPQPMARARPEQTYLWLASAGREGRGTRG